MYATQAERFSFWSDKKGVHQINGVVIIENVCFSVIQRKVPGSFALYMDFTLPNIKISASLTFLNY